ncbi:MAG: DUF1858 domain-containing protein [Nitrospirota bacterium]
MDRYHKLFIKASILYLIVGSFIGLLISLDAIDPFSFRFAHIHFNLLGFMAMMIYGVAYHILPRFNGSPLKWPGLVKLHFYLANTGLIGMVLFYILRIRGLSGFSSIMIGLFAMLSVASIILFAINIYSVLKESSNETDEEKITLDMKVSYILETWPGVLPIFISNGFKTLASPLARTTMGRLVTIRQACKIHKVDPDIFLTMLNAGVKKGKMGETMDKGYSPSEVIGKSQPTIKDGDICTKDVLVGDLLRVYPETKPVFERHYGESCFQCPGQAYETIGETANMHNMDVTMILDEINNIIINIHERVVHPRG